VCFATTLYQQIPGKPRVGPLSEGNGCGCVRLRSEPAFAFFNVVAQAPTFMESSSSAELQTRPHSVLMSHQSDFVVYTKQVADDPSAADGDAPTEFIPLCSVGQFGSESMPACRRALCEVILQQSTVLRAVACHLDGTVDPSAVETRFFPVRAFPPQVRVLCSDTSPSRAQHPHTSRVLSLDAPHGDVARAELTSSRPHTHAMGVSGQSYQGKWE
jgi:hypothetical protein